MLIGQFHLLGKTLESKMKILEFRSHNVKFLQGLEKFSKIKWVGMFIWDSRILCRSFQSWYFGKIFSKNVSVQSLFYVDCSLIQLELPPDNWIYWTLYIHFKFDPVMNRIVFELFLYTVYYRLQAIQFYLIIVIYIIQI